MKLRILFIGGILLAILLLFLFKDNLYVKFAMWRISLDVSGFHVTQVSKGTSLNQEYVELSDGKKVVKIIRTIPTDNKKYISDKLFLLSAFFELYVSPYPEAITNTVVCPREFKPVRISTKFGRAYKLYAGERFNYGICVEDLVKYKSTYAIFDCKSKGVFEVNTFSRNDFSESIVKSFSCNE